MFGAHDEQVEDSQFFELDLGSGLATALGPLYAEYDFEAMDIHPDTGIMYAIAGGYNVNSGNAYIVDKETGSLTLLGNTGTGGPNEIVSAAFHPDGTFWAFQEGVGLVTIDLTTLAKTVVWDPSSAGLGVNWEGLAWNHLGNMLYGSEGQTLYQWNPTTQVATQLCGSNFLPGDTEAMDFRDDGALLGGWHNAPDMLGIFVIDYDACTISSSDYNIDYNDVESIAFDLCIPEGSISGSVISQSGQPLAGVEVHLVAAGPNRALESVLAYRVEGETDGDKVSEDDVIVTQLTDSNGRYHFTQLPADLYAVVLANDKLEGQIDGFPYTVVLKPGEVFEQEEGPTAVTIQEASVAGSGLATLPGLMVLAGGGFAFWYLRKREEQSS
jgi:hypothetical protein